MLEMKRFVCNPLQENCYVVSDETRQCVVIDCGAFYEEEHAAIVKYLRDGNLTPCHLLVTHGHFDHNFGNEALYKEFGLQPELCGEDADLVLHLADQTLKFFGVEAVGRQQPPVGRLLKHGDTISFGSHVLEVLQTPGHSQGSCLFYCQTEQVVFTGDTLFRMSIGRTDFPESSWEAMEHSLQTVVTRLPAETRVLPGHGPESTIADELRYNPYLRS